nr:MAG: capsid protein [Cressdnaviricota sp.]
MVAVYRVPYDVTAKTGISVGTYVYMTGSPCHSGYTPLVGASSEFVAQSKLFDEFCITKCVMKYTPFFNTTQPTNAGVAGDPRIYTIVDRDGNIPVSSAFNVPNKLQTYDSYRQHTIYKPFSRNVKCKSFWMDTGIAQIDPQADAGTAQPWVNAGMTQVLVMYAQNIPVGNNLNLGTMTLEWSVKFRGKKSVTFGYDPASGSVIMTPTTSWPKDVPVTGTVQGGGGYDETIECNDVGSIVVRSNLTGDTGVYVSPDS